jgi:hypothetical protein
MASQGAWIASEYGKGILPLRLAAVWGVFDRIWHGRCFAPQYVHIASADTHLNISSGFYKFPKKSPFLSIFSGETWKFRSQW